jgi:hypothetical protein
VRSPPLVARPRLVRPRPASASGPLLVRRPPPPAWADVSRVRRPQLADPLVGPRPSPSLGRLSRTSKSQPVVRPRPVRPRPPPALGRLLHVQVPAGRAPASRTSAPRRPARVSYVHLHHRHRPGPTSRRPRLSPVARRPSPVARRPSHVHRPARATSRTSSLTRRTSTPPAPHRRRGWISTRVEGSLVGCRRRTLNNRGYPLPFETPADTRSRFPPTHRAAARGFAESWIAAAKCGLCTTSIHDSAYRAAAKRHDSVPTAWREKCWGGFSARIGKFSSPTPASASAGRVVEVDARDPGARWAADVDARGSDERRAADVREVGGGGWWRWKYEAWARCGRGTWTYVRRPRRGWWTSGGRGHTTGDRRGRREVDRGRWWR